MAELAAGAVNSLLVVINNEILLLRGVRDDVQFIKEEMESMNSFLAHLARTEPPSGHNEQVRTWMSQVRQLAQDCNNSINLYLHRGNPDIHRARAGLRRYLWWARWLLHKLVAQHNAAMELSQLKERARDVGERRLRYGVEVPAKSAGGRSARAGKAGSGGYAAADDEEDRDYHQLTAATTGQHRRRAFFEPPTLEDYVKTKLLEWGYDIPSCAGETLSLAIVAPKAGQDVLALAHETLVVLPPRDHTGQLTPSPALQLHLNFLRLRAKPIEGLCGYNRGITVDIPAVHLSYLPLRPEDVLYYILRELQHAKSRHQKHEKDEGQEQGSLGLLQDYRKKRSIYLEKERVFSKIEECIKIDEIHGKLDRIKSDVKARRNKDKQKQLHEDLEQEDLDLLDLGALFVLLHHSADLHGSYAVAAAASSQQDQVKNDESIMTVAMKLQQYIEAKEEAKECMGVVEEAGESGEQDMEEEEKQGEEDGTRRDSCKENDDKEEHNEENEKENNSGGRKEENDDKEEKRGGASGESKEKEENERQKELQNDTKGKEEGGGEGRKKKKQEEGNEGGEEEYFFASLFEEEEECSIHLDELQYAHIIREVFEKTINKKPLQDQQQDRSETKKATKTMATVLSEERVTEIIHKTKQEILKELQEGKLDKNKAFSEPTDTATNVPSQNKKDDSELEQKFEEMKQKFKEQLKIKGLVEKIKDHFVDDCPLIILKVDRLMDESIWEDTRKALSLLKLSADVLIFTTIKDIKRAKRYCYPSREPIVYSLFGLYHHTVLELTNEQKNEDNNNPMLFREILEECEPHDDSHDFCMRIFTHALHANPKRSTEELKKLRDSLRTKPKSFDVIAKKMFKYSYNDLPKEYKSCLLYLAIFPQGQSIQRSTLVGRWVAEGLIFKEDWHGSVLEANRCFDALINRWLVYPADIGATGKVKSCLVGDLVHGFITTIARKQHIVETRLSHRFARHFSIFNDLRLRNTDKIEKFLEMLSKSSKLSLHKLKILDLEGCQCFDGKKRNERYLKEICSKMFLLKYLSLRRTGICHLPDEINNLRELEVLDIRETKVPANATGNVLLLKLKRLLAGNSDLSPSNSAVSSSVWIPDKIGKMENMEVLSNVEVKSKRDFKEIGGLCHLRKLGVLFEDKDIHIKHLLRTIKNLHECLCSLSITLSNDTSEGIPSGGELLPRACSAAISLARWGRSCSCTLMDLSLCTGPVATASAAEQAGPNLELEQPPKHLESLSISGNRGYLLLPWFAKDGNNTLTKVTLSKISLSQDHILTLAKVPKLRCVRLQQIAYDGDVLTFKTDGFKYLKYLLVEASTNLTRIDFQDNAADELEMMVLSSTRIESVSGVATLEKLEELELNNNHSSSSLLLSFEHAKKIVKLTLCGTGTLLQQGVLQMLSEKPNLQCLVLLDTPSDAAQNKICFNEVKFLELNLLDVRHSAITEIVFAKGSARKLQKIIWSSRTSLSGIRNLPRLKELESHGGRISDEVKKDIDEHRNKPKHKHIEPESPDQVIGQDDDDNDGSTRFPFC